MTYMPLAPRTLAILVAVVVASSASLFVVHAALTGPASGSGTDYGLDTNGNGKYDWLVVDADVTLPTTGMWTINAVLSSPTAPTAGACGPQPVPVPLANATPVMASLATYPIAWAYERYFFTSGAETVRIAFNGTEIYRAGVDGPYGVELTLYPGDYPNIYAPMMGGGVASPRPYPSSTDAVTWSYGTRAYAATDFEEPFRAAYFTGAHADAGVDLDGDGLYDFLAVTASVHVEAGGNYSLNGNLWWSPSVGYGPSISLGYAYATVSLSPGDTTITLSFRGDAIRAANVDGPYNFSLMMYGPYPPPYMENGTMPPIAVAGTGLVAWPSWYPETLCGATGPYRADQFDAVSEAAAFTGAFMEATPDWDGDGLYDGLTIRAEVRVYAGSSFALGGVLHSGDGTILISSVNYTVWLMEGVTWVDWTFPAADIHARGVDGPYLAILSLQPGPRGIDPMVNYTTAAYKAASFDADTVCYNCTAVP